MQQSKLYTYIKNQYLMGNFTSDEMVRLVELNRITDGERIKIIEEVV
ncbi:hypothetical protein [Rummeliibacillus sp. TYF-LIM-RU47]|nr:hypothetical protein [Rummeliibacillus sp. TYF-LIM-RU47]